MIQKHSRSRRESQLKVSISEIIHKAPTRLLTKATGTYLNGPNGQIIIKIPRQQPS